MSIVSIVNDNIGDSGFVNAQKPIPPSITGYSVQNSDDTALLPAGGQTVLLAGTGFQPGATVTFDGSQIDVVSWINVNQLSFTSPAKPAGTYTIYVINADGSTAVYIPGLIYSEAPTWTTSPGSLGSYYETTNISNTLQVTGDSPFTYGLVSGTLPPGSTLYANGVISGTAPVNSGSTTYSFTVEAIDAQNQSSVRSFSLTINTDVVTWINPPQSSTISLSSSSYNTVLSASSAAGYDIASYTANALPDGLSLTGNVISGTPLTTGNVTTLLTATAATSGRSSSNTITWVVSLGDDYWSSVAALLSASTPTTVPFNSDASTNNFAVTINGDTKPSNFNPYTTGYYSNYFDGTGDYLSGTATTLNFSTNDFSIEWWMYPTKLSVLQQVLFQAGSGSLAILMTGGNGTIQSGRYQFAGFLDSTGKVTANAWNHVVVTRKGTTWRTFINGVLQGYNASYNFSPSPNNNLFTVGGGGVDNAFTGYISNFLVFNGSIPAAYDTSATTVGTVVYTMPMTPADPTGASLLVCQSNRLVDATTNNATITKNGDTRVSSLVPYLPNSSYSTYGSTYFDGNGDYLTVASNTAFGFGTGDFTIECWIYPTNAGAALQQIYDNRTATADTKVNIGVRTNTITYCVGSAILLTSASSSIVTNAWQHVAVVKSSGTTKIYINGTQSGPSYTDSYNFTSPAECVIATPGDSRGSATYSFAGYISNMRVTKGQAVYTANFTPPTTLLTSTANTSLLTCQTDQPVSNNTFIDNSTNNLAITRAGNTTQGTFSPYGENWSNYFDGNGDYLTTPLPSLLGTNFTVEFFIYFNTFTSSDTNNYQTLLGVNNYHTTLGNFLVMANYNGSGYAAGSMTIFHQDTAKITVSSGTFSLGTWYHVALVRSGGTSLTLYKNGNQIGTATINSSDQYGASDVGYIISGQNSFLSRNLNGYISNLRIVPNSALYTSAFTPSTTPLQPIANTSLLTCQSPNLVDKSANNFAITKVGDVRVQKFGPFPGTTLPTPYYSASFNGTTDYLSTATSSALTIGTNQFTVELWVYHKAAGASEQYLDSASSGFSLSKNTSNQLVLSQSGVSVIFTSTGTIAAGQWNHIAIVRNASNVITMYINGTASGTATVTTNFSNNYFYIGRQQAAAAAYLNGYVSNLRIVVGSAVYTANFTPPTSPLPAITNTQLLACQSNSFIDNSSNNIVITSNGSVRPTTFNPFTVSYFTKQSYTPAVYGGSMYFDGTGDYLTIPTSSFLVPSNTYTIEFWMNPAAYPGGTSAASLYQVTNANVANFGGLLIEFYATGTIRLAVRPATGGTNVTVTATGTIPLNAWTHIAVNVNAGAATIYVNGVSAGTGTVVVLDGTQTFCSSGYLTNGYTTSQVAYNGYLSDLRVVKGQAIYTSNFVPQNKPLTALKNTTLLLNGTSAGIYDSSEMVNLETVGDAKLSTTMVKFSGSTSMYFDGTGDYLYSPANPNFVFGSGNFTVESWFYLASSTSNQCLIDFRSSSTSTVGFFFGIVTNGYIQVWNNANIIYYNAGITTGTWYHIALVRNSTTMAVYLNGTSVATATNSTNFTDNICRIGSSISAVENLNGYLSDLRITKGVARYTSNFTPSTVPFPTQ